MVIRISDSWRARLPAIVVVVYIVYLVLVTAALYVAISSGPGPFATLTPAITMALHLFFLVCGILLIEDYVAYPADPLPLFLFTDVIMAVVAASAFTDYFDSTGPDNRALAIGANVVAIWGNLLCVWKATVLYSNIQ